MVYDEVEMTNFQGCSDRIPGPEAAYPNILSGLPDEIADGLRSRLRIAVETATAIWNATCSLTRRVSSRPSGHGRQAQARSTTAEEARLHCHFCSGQHSYPRGDRTS